MCRLTNRGLALRGSTRHGADGGPHALPPPDPGAHQQEPPAPGGDVARHALRTEPDGYDLWRLRTNGLIERIGKSYTYVLTPKGIRVCLFYTKSYRRIIDPLFAASGDRTAGQGGAGAS